MLPLTSTRTRSALYTVIMHSIAGKPQFLLYIIQTAGDYYPGMVCIKLIAIAKYWFRIATNIASPFWCAQKNCSLLLQTYHRKYPQKVATRKHWPQLLQMFKNILLRKKKSNLITNPMTQKLSLLSLLEMEVFKLWIAALELMKNVCYQT